MDTAMELVITVYRDVEKAGMVLRDLRQTEGDSTFKIKDAAVIVKDEKGHAHIKDSEDVPAGHGALFGAVTGAVVGLLGGPAGAVVGAVAGAATGGAAAKVLDMGFPDDQLKDLQASMAANSSALLVLVEHTWVEKLMREMEKQPGTSFRHEINPAVVNEYEHEAARR
jgi:uncharacterized membrane protein